MTLKFDISCQGLIILESEAILSPQRNPTKIPNTPLIEMIIVCLQKEPRCSDILLVYHEHQNCPIKAVLQLTGLVRKLLTLEQQMALASTQSAWPSWMLHLGGFWRNSLCAASAGFLIQIVVTVSSVRGTVI